MNGRLADAFASARLIRPSIDQPDLVHLSRAIAALCGAHELGGYAATQRLAELIGPAEHLIFVLLDGLGMNVVDRLPADSFIRRHVRAQICATCPSTTAVALTSVATGQWPALHAVTGWFTHLPEFGLTATLLPFTERFTQQPLAARGLDAQAVLPIAAVYPNFDRRSLTLLPSALVNTAYASYSRGYTPGAGYSTIGHAIDQVLAHIALPEPTHTHLYVPDVDTLCHRRGVEHQSVLELALQIDRELARLADSLPPRARLVVSADHGLIDIDPADHFPIFAGDPLLELLAAPPSGDARLPLFHLRPGRRQAFLDLFQERFARSMVLLDIEQAESLRLFGPEPMSPIARRRFGDFVAIPDRPATLLYHPPNPMNVSREPYRAQHAGPSPQEMLVPLVLA